MLSRGGGLSVLPDGEVPLPNLSGTAYLRWEPARALRLIGQLTYLHDVNRTVFRDDETGIAELRFSPPAVLSVDLALQFVL